ncbi:hypothetical protein PVAG01_04543 [Phlyctema vagabunda]|uniref:Amidase domain-containing protein n=1 Tax=Phlyctema vagabunda TaxID=108571 RepID=A0ABR4PIH8_9HELO
MQSTYIEGGMRPDDTILGNSSFDKVHKIRIEDSTVGFGDGELWRLPEILLAATESYKKQTMEAYRSAINLFISNNGKVVYPVALDTAAKVTFEGKGGYGINRKSPGQTKLQGMRQDATPSESLSRAIAAVREATGPDNVDRVLREHNLDVILVPTDSHITTVAALAGYPIATMPLGYLEESGRPFGLSIISTAHSEATILGVMNAWELADPKRRQIPAALLKYESKL